MKKKKIKRKTIENDEEYLRQKSAFVDVKKDSNLIEELNTLRDYCKKNDVLAMAAVQLKIPKRLIYLKNANLEIVNKIQKDSISENERKYDEARFLINPVIIKKEGLTDYWENCASCLDYCGRVLRPYRIEVEFDDLDGCKKHEIFEGFASTVLSHEIDHLDGILHMDIAEEIKEMPLEERKLWRQTHGYKIYSKTGNYNLLKKNFG